MTKALLVLVASVALWLVVALPIIHALNAIGFKFAALMR